jgi:hypothetical protein
LDAVAFGLPLNDSVAVAFGLPLNDSDAGAFGLPLNDLVAAECNEAALGSVSGDYQ